MNYIKRVSIVIILVVSCALMLVPNVSASKVDNEIRLMDRETHEIIKNSNVEIVILSNDKIIYGTTDDQGILLLDSNMKEIIKDESIYISVKGPSYIGEMFTNVSDNCIYLQRTLARGATDWNTIKTESAGYIWVPLTRVPTTGGLTTTFTLGQSSSFTISGGGLSSTSFSYLKGEAIEKYISSNITSTTGDRWMYIFGYVLKYKLTQATTTGEKRIVYGIGNNVKSLKKEMESTKFASLNDTTASFIFQKGEKTGHSIKRTTTTSFSLQGTLKTDYGNYTAKFGGSSSKYSILKHESNGKYKIYISYNSVYKVK